MPQIRLQKYYFFFICANISTIFFIHLDMCKYFCTFAENCDKMLLGFLLSILTATYVVSSTTTVEQTGVAPRHSVYRYERSASTGQKGQMTAGHSTRLQLVGWDGCVIRSVALQMRSNKASGAGMLTMKVGKQAPWKILDQSFSDSDWAGVYTTDWVEIRKEMNVQVGDFEEIDILVSATENSLYISSYSIEYEHVEGGCYTTRFVTGLDMQPDELMQSEVGEPIVLPAWQDTAIWHFMGWSEVEILDTTALVTWLDAGSEYVPERNTTLWAVYSDVVNNTALVDYRSGQYAIAMKDEFTVAEFGSGVAMSGEVMDGYVSLCGVEMKRNGGGKYSLFAPVIESMIYEVAFEGDSALSLMHVESGTFVGYKNTRLHSTPSLWQSRVLADSSLAIFTTLGGGKQYALCTSFDDNNNAVVGLRRLAVDDWTENAFWLFPVVRAQYTSWPFGKMYGVEDIVMPSSEDNGVHVLDWGKYKLYIKDGKKWLLLQ